MAEKLDTRTAQLLREAIVLAHAEGARWAGYSGGRNGYPKDSDVVARVLSIAANNEDLYSTLGALDEAQHADMERKRQALAELLSVIEH